MRIRRKGPLSAALRASKWRCRPPCIRAADPQKQVDFRIYLGAKADLCCKPRKASRSALQYQTSGAPTARFNSEGCSGLHLGAALIPLIRFTLPLRELVKSKRINP